MRLFLRGEKKNKNEKTDLLRFLNREKDLISKQSVTESE